MQVRDFLQEAGFPNLFDMLVRFVLVARIVNVALGVLVAEPTLEPTLLYVHKRAVLRNVLFLDHCDFLIQASAKVCFVKSALIHIVVHRLLFGGGDYHCVENGLNIVFL